MINKKHILSYFSVLFIAVGFLFSGCQKDESVLNDYDLWGRLASGSGTWQIVKIETFENNVPNPTIYTEEPEDGDVSHFYIRSFEVSGILIDDHTVNIYSGQNLKKMYSCAAEKDRVVYNDGELFDGYVFTVEENKAKKQVWNYTDGTTTNRYTFKKCDCLVPNVVGDENGG